MLREEASGMPFIGEKGEIPVTLGKVTCIYKCRNCWGSSRKK